MDKHVLTAIIRLNKAKAFLVVNLDATLEAASRKAAD
jgi:hypothetical protein